MAKNKEKVKAYNREYRLRNIDRLREYKRDLMQRKKAEYAPARKAYLESPEGNLSRIRGTAKGRNIHFALVLEDILYFWGQPCKYCGREVSDARLDRIDSSIGYVIDNVVQCCSMCNISKNVYSVDEFIEMCCLVAIKSGKLTHDVL